MKTFAAINVGSYEQSLKIYTITKNSGIRVYFQLMKKLSVDIAQESVDNVSMDVLSMGMTIDYQTAIEEGSTCVRVGTGIFGTRTVADME